VFCFRLEAITLASIAEIVVEVGLVTILETNVVEHPVVVERIRIAVVQPIVSIVKALYVGRMVVELGISDSRFAMCFCVDGSEG
jgi:hypothetical protein